LKNRDLALTQKMRTGLDGTAREESFACCGDPVFT